MQPIEFELDSETYTTNEKTLTPTQIMQIAGVDPATHYLVELKGKHEQKSYEGKPDESIHMHPNMRFIAPSTAPATVSAE